jgi:hypothetical protein
LLYADWIKKHKHQIWRITMKRLTTFLFCVAIIFSTGCASQYMQPVVHSATSAQLTPEQSAIVFFRDTSFGGAIQAPIAEDINGNVSFVGIVSANTKFLHKTSPGQHVYIVGGESSNLLFTDLAPQKFYYVRVSPKIGLLKARFKFEPVLPGDAADLADDLDDCKWVAPNAESQAWFADNRASMQDKLNEALADDKKDGPAERINVRTNDGLPNLINALAPQKAQQAETKTALPGRFFGRTPPSFFWSILHFRLILRRS